MEVILIISAIFIFLVGLFFIIDRPFIFTGLYFFIILYKFNIELPGPLDLRGVLTLILFVRLILFDKEHLGIILNKLLKNKIFIFITIFELYFLIISYINSDVYKITIRLFIFQFIGLLIGFIVSYKDYAKKSFFYAFIFTGIVATIDLLYSFIITSQLFVRRVLDVFLKSEYDTDLNHNFFGMLNGLLLVTTYVKIVLKKINLKYAFLLLTISGIGILLSTSRSALLTAIITIIIGTIILPKHIIDKKKILKISLQGIVVFLIVIAGYFTIVRSLNIDSKFSDKIYYRLVEEPLSLAQGKTSTFRGESKFLKEGSASWRFNKAFKDFEKYLDLSSLPFLFGFGYNGYLNIGESAYDRFDNKIYIASHNGIITLIIERGLLGGILFIIINFLLIRDSVRLFNYNSNYFPFFIVVIYTFIYTFGAAPLLLDRFGYILIGGIIGQIIRAEKMEEDNV